MQNLKTLIIGVGGAGCNALEQLHHNLHHSVSFLAINTDAQSLANSSISNKLTLGKERLRGLSSGGDPKLARKIAESDKELITNAISGANLIFLVTGLGGGTGSGAAPFIAQVAKKQGALVIAFATLPFTIEGAIRNRLAESTLTELRSFSQAVIPLPNDLLLQQLDSDATVLDAFAHANQWIHTAIHSILSIMSTPGIINLDFTTLQKAFSNSSGKTLFSLASAQGPDHVEQALNQILISPFLHLAQSAHAADSLIINIIGGKDLSLKTVNHISSFLAQQFKSNDNTVIGAVIDESKEQYLEICIIGVTRSSRSTSTKKGRGASSSENPRQQVLFDDSSLSKATSKNSSHEAIQQRGYFYQTESNIFDGEDLDIPTYLRRGIRIKL